MTRTSRLSLSFPSSCCYFTSAPASQLRLSHLASSVRFRSHPLNLFVFGRLSLLVHLHISRKYHQPPTKASFLSVRHPTTIIRSSWFISRFLRHSLWSHYIRHDSRNNMPITIYPSPEKAGSKIAISNAQLLDSTHQPRTNHNRVVYRTGNHSCRTYWDGSYKSKYEREPACY